MEDFDDVARLLICSHKWRWYYFASENLRRVFGKVKDNGSLS
jgi:hypothetical protein